MALLYESARAAYRLSGLVLQVRSMPSDKWFDKMTSLLESTSADLLVLQSDTSPWDPPPPDKDDAPQKVTLREIERGSLLLQPVRRAWQIPITPFAAWDSDDSNDSVSPTLLLLPKMEKKQDNPATRGMIFKVKHLIEVEEL